MVYLISFGVFIGVFMLAILIILWVGIDVRVAFNLDNSFALVNCFILKTLFLIKFKVVVWDGEFYMKIGGGAYRRLSYFKSDTQNENNKKVRFPRLSLHDVKANICVGAEDNPILAVALISTAGILVNNIQQFAHNRVKIKGYNKLLKPEFAKGSLKVSVDVNIKFSFISLIVYLFKVAI